MQNEGKMLLIMWGILRSFWKLAVLAVAVTSLTTRQGKSYPPFFAVSGQITSPKLHLQKLLECVCVGCFPLSWMVTQLVVEGENLFHYFKGLVVVWHSIISSSLVFGKFKWCPDCTGANTGFQFEPCKVVTRFRDTKIIQTA